MDYNKSIMMLVSSSVNFIPFALGNSLSCASVPLIQSSYGEISKSFRFKPYNFTLILLNILPHIIYILSVVSK